MGTQRKPILHLIGFRHKQKQEGGQVATLMPESRRKEISAKIYLFKLNQGVLPNLVDCQWFIPVAVDEFFADGDLEKAIREAAPAIPGAAAPSQYYNFTPLSEKSAIDFGDTRKDISHLVSQLINCCSKGRDLDHEIPSTAQSIFGNSRPHCIYVFLPSGISPRN